MREDQENESLKKTFLDFVFLVVIIQMETMM